LKPQLPQLCGSLLVLTQTPLHKLWPTWQGWQVPLVQIPLRQSEFARHCLPLAHFGQTGPPQSTSVSWPFLIPSVQVAGAVQTPLTQVLPDGQTLPQAPQLAGSLLVATQSPLHKVKPAWQGEDWQTPLTQKPLRQSEFARHCLPLAHFGQTGPPQSTSVSWPFLIPSLQVGAGGVQVPLTQMLPDGQTLPQAPQLFGSLPVLMQIPLQLV
jgi:hypothetical protein